MLNSLHVKAVNTLSFQVPAQEPYFQQAVQVAAVYFALCFHHQKHDNSKRISHSNLSCGLLTARFVEETAVSDLTFPSLVIAAIFILPPAAYHQMKPI